MAVWVIRIPAHESGRSKKALLTRPCLAWSVGWGARDQAKPTKWSPERPRDRRPYYENDSRPERVKTFNQDVDSWTSVLEIVAQTTPKLFVLSTLRMHQSA